MKRLSLKAENSERGDQPSLKGKFNPWLFRSAMASSPLPLSMPREIHRVEAKRYTSFLTFVGCAAAACCLVLASSRGGSGSGGQQEVSLLERGGLDVPVALKRAFAEGFANGEKHESELQSLSGGVVGHDAQRSSSSSSSSSSGRNWADEWQATAKMARQQAIGRLQGKKQGFSDWHVEGGDEPSWRDYAFAPHVPVRRPTQSLAMMMAKLQEERAVIGHEISTLKHQVMEEKFEASRLSSMFGGGMEESLAGARMATMAGARMATKGHAKTQMKSSAGDKKKGTQSALTSYEEYEANLAKKDKVKKSHLAITEDPKKAEEYSHKELEKYWSEGGPESNFKMFQAAEHKDFKTFSKIWHKYNDMQTGKEGNDQAPNHSKGMVDASQDGVHD